MKTYQYIVRSYPDGLKEYASVRENGAEIKRIDRDVQQETVMQFRTRVGAQLEAEGCVMAEHQYTL